MKKKPSDRDVPQRPAAPDADELRAEYDPQLIRQGERGKYAARYAEGTNLVLLEPDVAEAFPDAAAVNEALRALLAIARRQAKPSRRSPAA